VLRVVTPGRIEAHLEVVGLAPVPRKRSWTSWQKSPLTPSTALRCDASDRRPGTPGFARHMDTAPPSSSHSRRPITTMPVYSPCAVTVSHWGCSAGTGFSGGCCSPRTTKRSCRIAGSRIGDSAYLVRGGSWTRNQWHNECPFRSRLHRSVLSIFITRTTRAETGATPRGVPSALIHTIVGVTGGRSWPGPHTPGVSVRRRPSCS
jgi:hypothetical protein